MHCFPFVSAIRLQGLRLSSNVWLFYSKFNSDAPDKMFTTRFFMYKMLTSRMCSLFCFVCLIFSRPISWVLEKINLCPLVFVHQQLFCGKKERWKHNSITWTILTIFAHLDIHYNFHSFTSLILATQIYQRFWTWCHKSDNTNFEKQTTGTAFNSTIFQSSPTQIC